jgi:hypothetical protein
MLLPIGIRELQNLMKQCYRQPILCKLVYERQKYWPLVRWGCVVDRLGSSFTLEWIALSRPRLQWSLARLSAFYVVKDVSKPRFCPFTWIVCILCHQVEPSDGHRHVRPSLVFCDLDANLSTQTGKL